MKFFDRILNLFSYKQKSFQRGFAAALKTRLRENWTTQHYNINYEIKNDLRTLRARSQDLRFNNPIVNGAVFDNRVNIVGPNGFDLQVMAKFPNGTEDTFANDRIKQTFDKWSNRKYASVSQRLSFLMIQYLIVDHLFLDGEVILRKITSGSGVKDNPFGFTLDFIDPNDIDLSMTEKLENGNYVITGVEVDEWNRIKGIWINKKDIIEQTKTISNKERIRIDASEIIYAMDYMHFSQIHGVTPLACVMNTLKDLDMWENYSLQNAKASASKMGFLIKDLNAVESYSGALDEDEEEIIDNVGGKYMDFEGGTIEELPAGYDFKSYTPEFPHSQHAEFVRNNGRKIATGLGRDYTSMFGDRENESYSSARSGELKMRSNYAYMQSIVREQILIPLYEDWLKYALLNKQIEPLSFANYDKYKEHWWQGYVKPWVDMQKEVDAQKTAEEAGYISKTQIVSQLGNRYEDVLADKKRERELEKKYGVDYGNNTTNTTN